MTLPIEALYWIGKEPCTEVHRIETRLGIPDYKLWGFLMRIGLKYAFYNHPPEKIREWYVGLMFFWFGVFFGMRNEECARDQNDRRIPGTYYRFSGLTIHYWPKKFKPGVFFWKHKIEIGKKEPLEEI